MQDTAGTARFEAWPLTPPPGPDEPVLTPPGGVGTVPADHPGVRLARSYGLGLVQVERVSRYDLAAPAVDPAVALQEAEQASADYDVVAWEGAADEGLRGKLAVLKERMATDVPAGERTVVEQVWDAARVGRMEEQILVTGRLFRAVARHRASGRVVAVSELVAPSSRADGLVDQWDTIVLPEHRGHRLGMRVKAANLVALRRVLPRARAIITWNAEENRHMLAVNEALGFRPVLVEASMEARGPLLPAAGPITLGEAVAAAARLVPEGRAVSYGALARLLGRGGARQAGRAMAESEPGTPWWRVVRADGSLPEDLAARARGHWEDEATPTRAAGDRVDLGRAAWEPDDDARAALDRLAARVDEGRA